MSDETPNSVTMQKDGEVAVIIVNNPPVNALSWHVREGLKTHFEAALADDGVKAIVLRCDGATFIADRDLFDLTPVAGVQDPRHLCTRRQITQNKELYQVR